MLAGIEKNINQGSAAAPQFPSFAPLKPPQVSGIRIRLKRIGDRAISGLEIRNIFPDFLRFNILWKSGYFSASSRCEISDCQLVGSVGIGLIGDSSDEFSMLPLLSAAIGQGYWFGAAKTSIHTNCHPWRVEMLKCALSVSTLKLKCTRQLICMFNWVPSVNIEPILQRVFARLSMNALQAQCRFW